MCVYILAKFNKQLTKYMLHCSEEVRLLIATAYLRVLNVHLVNCVNDQLQYQLVMSVNRTNVRIPFPSSVNHSFYTFDCLAI